MGLKSPWNTRFGFLVISIVPRKLSVPKVLIIFPFLSDTFRLNRKFSVISGYWVQLRPDSEYQPNRSGRAFDRRLSLSFTNFEKKRLKTKNFFIFSVTNQSNFLS